MQSKRILAALYLVTDADMQHVKLFFNEFLLITSAHVASSGTVDWNVAPCSRKALQAAFTCGTDFNTKRIG